MEDVESGPMRPKNPYYRDKINDAIYEREEAQKREEEVAVLAGSSEKLIELILDEPHNEPSRDFGYYWEIEEMDGWKVRYTVYNGVEGVLAVSLHNPEEDFTKPLARVNTKFSSATDGEGEELPREEIQQLTDAIDQLLEPSEE